MNWLRRLILFALALLVLSLAYARVITDWWWFQAQGYPTLLTRPWAWRGGAVAGAFVVAWVVLWLNAATARRALARLYEAETSVVGGRVWNWHGMRRGLSLVVAVLAALVAIPVGSQWVTIAQAWYGRPFGVADPVFGRDAGVYVFQLPAWRLGLTLLAVSLVMGALLAALLYGAAGFISWRRKVVQDSRARRHLLWLGAAGLVLWAIWLWLARYELLFSPMGAVYGATYTDLHVRLPVRTVTAVAAALAAVVVAGVAWGRGPRLRWAILLLAVAVGLPVAGELLAGLVQRLVVRPNELVRERPYLVRHIEWTRRGWALDRVRTREFVPQGDLSAEAVARQQALLSSIRLWDWRPLQTVFAQLQEFRPYYDFLEVDVDRYRLDGMLRQVMLSPRELTSAKVQNPSWVNLRLQYTHGYGVVLSPVNAVTPEGLPQLWLADIPPQSRQPWAKAVERPQIYYGETSADWVVVGTRADELDHPAGERNAFTRYAGKGGVPVGSLWRRLLFAVRFRSVELLVSRELSATSRILMYRPVMERVQRLAPFLRYDRDPYLVITDAGRLVWMLDAYTTADRLPYSAPQPGWGNYVRNAIKVTIDAYDGTVRFYLYDPSDPVARTLGAIFPGWLRPAESMPADLQRHVRYPEDLFRAQARMFSVYHMTDADLFYNQEDRWELPREIVGQAEVPLDPYYALARVDEGPVEFVLMLPFTPAGKQNMVAWMVARMDAPHYGQLTTYLFPKQRLTYGPMQIEARINQDPDISRELTLWGQRGSRVERGNLIIVPVENSLLYVEPLFLVSEQSQLPELRRVIVSTGSRLVMAPTLEQALASLTGAAPTPSAGVQPAPAPQTQAPGPQPPGAAAATLQEEVRQALVDLEAARRLLQEGDWRGFGERMQQLEDRLRRLESP